MELPVLGLRPQAALETFGHPRRNGERSCELAYLTAASWHLSRQLRASLDGPLWPTRTVESARPTSQATT